MPTQREKSVYINLHRFPCPRFNPRVIVTWFPSRTGIQQRNLITWLKGEACKLFRLCCAIFSSLSEIWCLAYASKTDIFRALGYSAYNLIVFVNQAICLVWEDSTFQESVHRTHLMMNLYIWSGPALRMLLDKTFFTACSMVFV